MKFVIGLQVFIGLAALVTFVLIILALMNGAQSSALNMAISEIAFLVLSFFVIPKMKETERILERLEESK